MSATLPGPWGRGVLVHGGSAGPRGLRDAAQTRPAILVGITCGLTFVLLAAPVHLHDGRSPIGSFADALLTSLIGAVVAFSALVVNFYVPQVRVSVAVTAPMCTFVMLLGGRATYRVLRDWTRLRAVGSRAEREPVVVVGAGNGAAQLVKDMVRDPSCAWIPVALLDDDPYKRHRRLNGVPVRRSDLPA